MKSNSKQTRPTFDIQYKKLGENENLYDDIPHDIQVVDAQYVKSSNEYDRGNIFIESLPFPRTEKELMCDFSASIYNFDRDKIRTMSLSEKLNDISMLREELRIELPFHQDLDNAVYQAFIKSYRNRKLCINAEMIRSSDNLNADNRSSSKLYKDTLNGQSYGSFNVIGYGGVGKSLAVSIVLRHYRQVIVHHLKNGGKLIQLLYINVQCPPNGNMETFYSNIGRAIDVALGYTYPCYQHIIDKRRGLGQKLNEVINLIERFNIGLIILDEIQMFLSEKKSKGSKVNVKTESFQAITTILNTTGVSIAVIGTEIAYRMIFEDQIHQNRRLGQSIYADEYCTNKDTFMRIMRTLIKYQWTDSLITEEDLTKGFLKAFMDCTHGIIDLIIGLYSAIQHEAVLNNRKSKINSAFIKKVAKKYYPNIMQALESIDKESYENIRKQERAQLKKYMEEDVSKEKNKEREKKIAAETSQHANRELLIRNAIKRIMDATDEFTYQKIMDAANEVFKADSYDINDVTAFTHDVSHYLKDHKLPRRKKAEKLSPDTYINILDNSNQTVLEK